MTGLPRLFLLALKKTMEQKSLVEICWFCQHTCGNIRKKHEKHSPFWALLASPRLTCGTRNRWSEGLPPRDCFSIPWTIREGAKAPTSKDNQHICEINHICEIFGMAKFPKKNGPWLKNWTPKKNNKYCFEEKKNITNLQSWSKTGHHQSSPSPEISASNLHRLLQARGSTFGRGNGGFANHSFIEWDSYASYAPRAFQHFIRSRFSKEFGLWIFVAHHVWSFVQVFFVSGVVLHAPIAIQNMPGQNKKSAFVVQFSVTPTWICGASKYVGLAPDCSFLWTRK